MAIEVRKGKTCSKIINEAFNGEFSEKMMKFKATVSRRLCLLLSTILLAVASFALSATPVAAETYTVKMGTDSGMLKFEPSSITVKPGDTVQWVMNKVPPHNVVFDDTKIPSGNKSLAKGFSHEKLAFSPGESFTTTFPADIEPGTYSYYCQPHRGAGMTGQVVVQE